MSSHPAMTPIRPKTGQWSPQRSAASASASPLHRRTIGRPNSRPSGARRPLSFQASTHDVERVEAAATRSVPLSSEPGNGNDHHVPLTRLGSLASLRSHQDDDDDISPTRTASSPHVLEGASPRSPVRPRVLVSTPSSSGLRSRSPVKGLTSATSPMSRVGLSMQRQSGQLTASVSPSRRSLAPSVSKLRLAAHAVAAAVVHNGRVISARNAAGDAIASEFGERPATFVQAMITRAQLPAPHREDLDVSAGDTSHLKVLLGVPAAQRSKVQEAELICTAARLMGFSKDMARAHQMTLMANLRLVSYNAGQTVCDQSTVCSWFGVVLEGSLVGWEQRHGSAAHVTRVKQQIIDHIQSALSTLRGKLQVVEPLVLTFTSAVSQDKTASTEKIALSTKTQLQSMHQLVSKARTFAKHARSTLTKGSFVANSDDFRERALLLAAKARSTLLATAQVVRSFDGSGSDALANQALYRGVAATLRDLEGALALFGDKVYDVVKGWRVGSNLRTVGDLAFMLHQKRHPFTVLAGSDAPRTTLLVLDGADMFSRLLLHTPRYTRVREKARELRRFDFLQKVPRSHAIRLAFEVSDREFAYGQHITVVGRECRTLYLIKEGEVRVAVPVEGTKRAELVERRAKGEDSAGASGGSPSQVLQAMARRQRTQPGAAASPKRRKAPLNVAREAPHADVLALLDEEAATSKMYGSQMDVALLGKGNVIGLQDMLGDTTISTSTVTANTSVRTLALPFSALLEKLPALPEVMEALRAAAEEYTQKWTSYSKRSDALIGDIRRSLTYAIRETKREHDSTLRHIKIRPAVEEEREAKEVDEARRRAEAGYINIHNITEKVNSLREEESAGETPAAQQQWSGPRISPRLFPSPGLSTLASRLQQGGKNEERGNHDVRGAHPRSRGGPRAAPHRRVKSRYLSYQNASPLISPRSRKGKQPQASAVDVFSSRRNESDSTARHVDPEIEFLNNLTLENNALRRRYCRATVGEETKQGMLVCRSTRQLGCMLVGQTQLRQALRDAKQQAPIIKDPQRHPLVLPTVSGAESRSGAAETQDGHVYRASRPPRRIRKGGIRSGVGVLGRKRLYTPVRRTESAARPDSFAYQVGAGNSALRGGPSVVSLPGKDPRSRRMQQTTSPEANARIASAAAVLFAEPLEPQV